MDASSAPPGYRRKFPRRALARVIGLLSAGTYHLADSGEIGEGGMSFAFEERIPLGSELVVNLRIPGGDFASMRAEVRSHADARDGRVLHGVAFKDVPFARRRQIRAFVSSRGEGESLIV